MAETRRAAVVFGASGGIGEALVRRLAQSQRFDLVFAGARDDQPNLPDGVTPFRFDLTDEASIASAASLAAAPVELVIIATGVLHDRRRGIAPEKSWRSLDAEAFARVLAINTIGPALIGKHFLPLLPRKGRAVFAALSARAGSIGDNRLGGWHAYRASKAALNMLMANFAIELARTRPDAIVAALHPGTVASGLSAPFQAGVAPETLKTPDQAADHLLALIAGLRPSDSGGFFAWNGEPIPW
jgi:NAD(P)-dependent dehydrogenase (short-subunit alcohol dehydrogenase family)